MESIITGLTVSEEDAGSIVGEDSLLHLEALLVVASGDSEDVSFELLAEDFTIDFLTHSSVEERTATKRVSGQQSHALFSIAPGGTGIRYLHVLFIFNINFLLATGSGITNVKLRHKFVRAE